MNDARTLFVSRRGRTLRALQLVTAAPVAILALLLTRMPAEEYGKLGVGGVAGLALLTSILPASFFFLHDRYVLKLAREPDGSLTLVTWLVFGKRTHRLPASALAGEPVPHAGRNVYGGAAPWKELRLPDGRSLVFDAAGDSADAG